MVEMVEKSSRWGVVRGGNRGVDEVRGIQVSGIAQAALGRVGWRHGGGREI
jgi:hypothetical protein